MKAEPIELLAGEGTVAIHISLNQADGGGGNRTRVRSRTVKSISKLSLPLNFARPAGGLANLPSG